MYLRRLILHALAPCALICVCGSIAPAEEGTIKVIPPRKVAVPVLSSPTAPDGQPADASQVPPVRGLTLEEQNRVQKA